MTSATSNNKSLKYQRFTSFGWRYIGIRKLGFVAKTQFLCLFLIFVRRMKSRRGTRPQSPTGNVTYKLDLLLVSISLQWFNNMCFNKCFFDNNLIFMFNSNVTVGEFCWSFTISNSRIFWIAEITAPKGNHAPFPPPHL